MTKEKTSDSIGLGYLIASFCFLFNPNISVIDVLPDFIGFFLFAAGLAKLADIMPRFAEVREAFLKLAWISLAKFFSFILLFIMPLNEQATFGLVLTFSFAIIDLIYLIPAWNGFFDGIIYLGTRFDGNAVFYTKKGKKTLTEKLKGFTIVFFVFKEVFVILPELTSLSTYESLGYVDYYVLDIQHFKPYFRVLASLFIVSFGIVWLCRMISYVRRLMADKPFVSSLFRVYRDEVLPDEDLFTRRRIKTALVTLCFAFGMGIDFYVQDVNFLPDFISAVLFVCGFLLLRKYLKKALPAVFVSAVYGAVSLAQWIQTIVFANNYDITHIDKDYDVFLAYNKICIGALIESLLFGILIFFVFAALKELINEHTGYRTENSETTYRARFGNEEKRQLRVRLAQGVVFALLTALSNVVYYYLAVDVGYIWMINFALCAVCAVIWVTRLNNIYEHVEDRYLR